MEQQQSQKTFRRPILIHERVPRFHSSSRHPGVDTGRRVSSEVSENRLGRVGGGWSDHYSDMDSPAKISQRYTLGSFIKIRIVPCLECYQAIAGSSSGYSVALLVRQVQCPRLQHTNASCGARYASTTGDFNTFAKPEDYRPLALRDRLALRRAR